jgi:hypothetical protein
MSNAMYAPEGATAAGIEPDGDPAQLFVREVADSMGMTRRLKRYMDRLDKLNFTYGKDSIVEIRDAATEAVRVTHAIARLQSAQARSLAALAGFRATPRKAGPTHVVFEHRRAIAAAT